MKVPSSLRLLFLLFMRQLSLVQSLSQRIGVIGGGASGIFSAIAAASHGAALSVTVLEATRQTLQKVKISGGGRCNVMHDTSKTVPTILQGYPRGSKELRGMFTSQFGPAQARIWFEERGVELKTEEDGRMFPTTDSSETIVNCLMDAADQAGVNIQLQTKVTAIEMINDNQQFQVTFQHRTEENPRIEQFDVIIIATGSAPIGYQLVTSLGHSIVPTVASLFTLSCKHAVKEGGLLHGLSGVSVPQATIQLKLEANKTTGTAKQQKKAVIQQEGPLLITHHGLSGPAALRLSAFAAREFAEMRYQAQLRVHWAPSLGNAEKVMDQLWAMTAMQAKKQIATVCPLPEANLPRRLWSALVDHAGLNKDIRWGDASKKQVRALAQQIAECSLEMTSKGAFKDEFVTAGGVDLKEIDLKTMQSKVRPGLFFCGEVNNVDGVTGGYNFMNCWGTGYVAGCNAAVHATSRQLTR